tara:strand:+ start:1238 stop:1507 length:270 start_codon:yes stop_codon:yes gene_type:complete
MANSIIPTFQQNDDSFRFRHNLNDLLGLALIEAFNSGRMELGMISDIARDRGTFNIGYDFDDSHSLDFGYNTRMGNMPVDYKLTFSKRF